MQQQNTLLPTTCNIFSEVSAQTWNTAAKIHSSEELVDLSLQMMAQDDDEADEMSIDSLDSLVESETSSLDSLEQVVQATIDYGEAIYRPLEDEPSNLMLPL